ncbi:glutaredoxin-C8-like [Zingiber officinale]|uniref:glutaredoxin-C8-like n=1 Tax=Zingiber officinale TaxID=94328 RepID=UPI001C4AA3B0|nr:glutaredoxin-C8-like [Zingiber officinale]XP_042470259.1 glutaredoxin-C8-like [Zingiber officinale]
MAVVAGVYCLWRPRLLCSRWLPPRASSYYSASDLVKQTVSSHDIVIFSKTYCPYCGTAKDVFKELKQEPHVLELDDRDDGPDIQDALSQLVGRNTVPQVFIHGEHLGGCDDTIEAYENGRLLTLLGINSKGVP